MQIGAGTARFLQGDTAAALQNFLAATDIDPTDPRPYSFLAASAAASIDQQHRVHNTFKFDGGPYILEVPPSSLTIFQMLPTTMPV